MKNDEITRNIRLAISAYNEILDRSREGKIKLPPGAKQEIEAARSKSLNLLNVVRDILAE